MISAALAGFGTLLAGAAERPCSAQTPPVTAQVVCHGDSLTWGANASSGLGKPGILRQQVSDPSAPLPVATADSGPRSATETTYPAVLARTLGPTWRVQSLGTGGWTTGLMTGEAPQKIDPLFDPQLALNVLIIFTGTNNLGGAHQDAATAFSELKAYCLARKAARPWRVLVVTPPMAAYPGVYPADFDTQMVQYDALIRANWRSFADGIIDVQADSRLGVPGAEHNSEYFSSQDFTHLTDAGYAIVGLDAAAAVRQLAAQLQPLPPKRKPVSDQKADHKPKTRLKHKTGHQ